MTSINVLNAKKYGFIKIYNSAIKLKTWLSLWVSKKLVKYISNYTTPINSNSNTFRRKFITIIKIIR